MSKFLSDNPSPNSKQSSIEELAQQQVFFNAFFAGAKTGLLVFDDQLRYVQINEALAEINGVSVADHLGRSIYEVLPNLASTLGAMLQNILDTGEGIFDYELIGETPKEPGVTRYWLASYYPLFDQNHQVFGIGGVVIEISDRKKTEKALTESEERFRSIMEASAQIIWTANEQGELVAEQPTWSAFTGQNFEQYKGWGWLDTVHPDDRSYLAIKWSNAVANRSLYEIEFRMRRFDGEYRYMSSRGIPILEKDGTIREWVGANTDITERKQAEVELKQSEERYRSLIKATSQMVWKTDSEGQLIDLEDWGIYTGQTQAEMANMGWAAAIHPEEQERTLQIWIQALQTKTLYETQYRVRSADGNYRYFAAKAVPVFNVDGSVREWMGTCTDIHDRKLGEIAIAQAKDAAEAASRAKSEFLANMSHELRTPLNGILGYAQVLQRCKQLQGEERSRVDVIYQCGSHLLTLINDILDLSKIEAQKVELILTDFHFPAFLQGVAEMCRVRAELKNIQFHAQFAPELPIGIRADEKRLRQVLINLLSNAIKFTDSGSVTFTIAYASEGKIRFEVRDTGVGIASEQIQAIFQPFEQVGETKRQTEGTGLGLAISQRIVQLMGSQIQVQSEVGVGSIFWFDVTLPAAIEWVKAAQTDHRGQIIGIKNCRPKVLIVDDKWENRSVINNLLSPIGFDVFEAVDGEDGWQKISEIQPDLVITDLLMPRVDGFELLKRIRTSDLFKELIVIVSSASVFEADQYRSLDAGGNAFIPKPVQASELLQQVQNHLHLEWIYEEPETATDLPFNNAEIVAPPTEGLAVFYDLAMKGNFKGIIKQATLLEEQDRRYVPFAQQLYQMAKEFQDEKIITFIQSYQ